MKRPTIFLLTCLILGLAAQTSFAQTNLVITDEDFQITDTFNIITNFEFNIELTDNVVAGGTFTNPAINSISYRIDGQLPNPTPSGFPGFALVRSYSGTEFYAQSPESGLDFSVDASADLSDGLQLSELVGTGNDIIFNFNAREFNQNPGRYHPPVFTLRADGTGRLQNANNQSTFPNPDPPIGSGMLVDVDFGEEYISDLSFNPSAVTVAVPEPSSAVIMTLMGLAGLTYRRR